MPGMPWLIVVLALLAPVAGAAEPKRVLLIHSSGRDFAPGDAVSQSFRSELARQFEQPVAFHEISLQAQRAGGGRMSVRSTRSCASNMARHRRTWW